MDIPISSCQNLLIEVYVVGYSKRGESIIILFIDSDNNNEVLYSLVIDCFIYKTINKTDEILKQHNTSSINMLVWSHPDLDHTKGLDTIITQYCNENTKIILPLGLNGQEFDKICYNREDKQIVRKIVDLNKRKKKTHITAAVVPELTQPIEIFNIVDYSDKIKIEMHALSPHSPFINSKIGQNISLKKNDLSIAILLKVGSYKLLFCSDIENNTISNIDSDSLNDAIFIKIPHHTSLSSSDLIEHIKKCRNIIGCTTVYTAHELPNEDLLAQYNKICKVLHTTGTSANKNKNHGIIKYTFDFYNKRSVYINLEGHAAKLT